ncbi:MAG: PQQ-binding-like beta-propeller repeat protein [Actinoplanes sp.]
MPTDLDEMFIALGRQADTLPLGPAASARRRGRQRTRTRAALAAAAAVCLITGGLAVTTTHRRADPSPAASPLPTVGKPIVFGGTARNVTTAISGATAYAVWVAPDGKTNVAGADLRTGAERFPAHALGTFNQVNVVRALPKAVVVDVQEDMDRMLYILDPATGEQRWKLPLADGDDHVYYENDLVHMKMKTGETRAFDWATGDETWRQPAGADPVVHTVGMRMEADAPRAGFSDPRLIQLTKGNRVLIRDAATGKSLGNVPGQIAWGDPYLAYEGTLYTVVPLHYTEAKKVWSSYLIRETDLTAPYLSRSVRSGPAGRALQALAPCGRGKLCVLDTLDSANQLASIDIGASAENWRVDAPPTAFSLESSGGRVLAVGGRSNALYDTDGKQVLLPEDLAGAHVGWIGSAAVLSLSTSGEVAKVLVENGDREVIGSVPPGTTAWAWNNERLVAATPTEMRVLDLGG